MTRAFEARACEACAAAKRRCGKQTPHCLRCRRRGIECTYPPTKPTSFVLCGDVTFPVEHDLSSCSTRQLSAYSPGLQNSGAVDARLSLGLDLFGVSSGLVDIQLASSWFASPATWEICRIPQERNSFRGADLMCHIIKIRRWLIQWVEQGSNPFIHSQLYRTRFPRCVQDAYSTLSCYLQKTAANEKTILQIIEDRAQRLLAEHGIPSADSSLENISASSVTLDSFEHIARVHALLVYQVLGLYDGDIRLRHLSESRIPVLKCWMQQMVEHASQAVCLGVSVISSAREQTAVDFSLSNIAHCEHLLWYSWILAESIRRTWVVASAIQTIYLMIQQGSRAPPCPGGMMFTTREGVWEAQSALAWERLCLKVNVGLIQMGEVDKLFTEIAPEDVNDFAKVILEATYGVEKMQRWGVHPQDGQS
ncbi:hypothetical protein V1525DRAFT_405419 [Lipomyces kononenkoae]|uniref:Uncharacterized protein n=1 Tax=Lipomyces kononenkoae TaxID=34357 RepID=A0ACC3T0I1_LIPKO